MKWRELHTNPLTVWISFMIGVAGLVYGVWTNWKNQPKREISYYQHSAYPFINLDLNGPNELAINGQRFSQGTVYSNLLYVWNSGNQPITIDDIGEPLQLAGVPSAVKLAYYGIRKDQVEGDIRSGLQFKLLYPNTGLALTFYTNAAPEISMSGSVSGGNGSSGLLKRVRWLPSHLGNYSLVGLGTILAVVSFFIILAFEARPKKEIPRRELLGFMFVAMVMGGMIFVIIIGAITRVINSDLPPF